VREVGEVGEEAVDATSSKRLAREKKGKEGVGNKKTPTDEGLGPKREVGGGREPMCFNQCESRWRIKDETAEKGKTADKRQARREV
jgi:hypothetical protein